MKPERESGADAHLIFIVSTQPPSNDLKVGTTRVINESRNVSFMSLQVEAEVSKA